MTTAITRAQVREALRVSKPSVPDFTTRKKMTLTWSKVYIAVNGNELRFVELNFLQRIIRYLAGCVCYTDTVFVEKGTLEKVKAYVHGIRTASEYHDPIVENLLPIARTKSDHGFLLRMLSDCVDIAVENNNSEAIEDLAVLTKQVRAFLDKADEGGASKDFLSEPFFDAATSLARQNLEKNPEDKLWMNITKDLVATREREAERINRLLLSNLKFPNEGGLPSLQIKVPDEIRGALLLGIKRASEAYKNLDRLPPLTLGDHLLALGGLEQINKYLDNLPEVLRPFLSRKSGKQMLQDLHDRLISRGADPSNVKAYLDDKQQVVSRLYYHADLFYQADQSYLSRPVKEKIKDYRAAVMEKISCNYKVNRLVNPSNSFSDSCVHFQSPSGFRRWRDQIADELPRHAYYQKLVEDRINKDERVKGFTFMQYCRWIRDSQSPIGLPELTVFSQITSRPVLIVQLDGNNFKWIDGINLSFAKEPIILNLDKEGIWAPVEPIKTQV